MKDFLGSSDEGAGTPVIIISGNSRDKENDDQMKSMSQLKMTSQMKVEGMLTDSV